MTFQRLSFQPHPPLEKRGGREEGRVGGREEEGVRDEGSEGRRDEVRKEGWREGGRGGGMK